VHKRVVQLGVQQRSGAHFQEAARLIQDGLLGKVTHAVLIQSGSYAQVMAPAEPPPADLDWEMFQGPAPRHPFSPSRLRWRGFYDYGGGLITDWGVHLAETALLALQADTKAPLHTSASAQYVAFPRDPEQLPDAFACAWQYDGFVMSFTNAVPPHPEVGQQGTYFYGPEGVLHINRSGYRVLPYPAKKAGADGKVPPPPIAARTVAHDENYNNDPYTMAHTRDFLDCVKSRRSPVADITTVGFHVTLPCLLARLAVKEGRSFGWDGKRATPA
jgi:predicted dehydrogenase